MATQRQAEMERRLPEASPNLCKFIWDGLNQAGLRLDPDTIRFIGKLISEYISNTEDGKHTILKLLKADIVAASPANTYYQASRIGEEAGKISHSDLVEFKGWIYKKASFVGHSRVSVIEKADHVGCEDCGILGPKDYCVQRVLTRTTSGKEALEDVCNHCRLYNQDPRIRDTAVKSKCDNCPILSCDHYPKKQIALLPPSEIRR